MSTPAASKPSGIVGKVKSFFALPQLEARIKHARMNVAHTPWSWADNGGLYYGDSDAWQYFNLPMTLVSEDGDSFETLLESIAKGLGNRKIHLALYGWEEPATPPPDVKGAHRAYINSSLRMLVPGQILVLGIALNANPSTTPDKPQDNTFWSGLRSDFTTLMDKSMAEWVPDLDAYTADRYLVAGHLAKFGLKPVHGSSLDMLEAWYSLGVSRDLELDETDDAIVVRNNETIEFLSVRSFADQVGTGAPTLPSPGEQGTLVVSVRGEVGMVSIPARTGNRTAAALSKASIVVGRRAKSAPLTLADSTLYLSDIEFKPLPMRQLPALNETLPASSTAVDPHLFNVTTDKLRRIGFTEPHTPGDRTGLLLGMTDPDYSTPLYLNLTGSEGRVLAIGGESASGKTFLAEHATLQALACDKTVLVINAGTDTGAPLLREGHVAVVNTPEDGLLDPFRFLDPALAATAAYQVITAAIPELTEQQKSDLSTAFQRAADADLGTLRTAIRLISDTKLTAMVARFLRSPAGKLLAGNHAASPPALGKANVWDAAAILHQVDAGMKAKLLDLLLAVAHTRCEDGLLVCDAVGDWSRGTLARETHTRLRASQRAGGLIVTTSRAERLVDDTLPPADLTVLLSAQPDAISPVFQAMRYAVDDDIVDWLSAAKPIVENNVVQQPALGLLWDAKGTGYGLSVGPVPLTKLDALTRGAANSYLADVVYS